MKNTKFIVRVAMSVAMLIGGQMALTAVSGIEIVTVMMLCLCFCYGIRFGIATATIFSLLRCCFFGFYINIVVLYLVYYNLFALFFGWLGKRLAGEMKLWKVGLVVASAVVLTVCFTLLDDVITPVISGFNWNATKVYFYQSLTAMVPQSICTAVTVSLLFVPLTTVIRKIDF